jgi:hypothetical protein
MMQYYTCSVCGAKVERELLVYMKHTDRHIIDEIKKKHPDWATSDGLCAKCADYYKKAMGKENPS